MRRLTTTLLTTAALALCVLPCLEQGAAAPVDAAGELSSLPRSASTAPLPFGMDALTRRVSEALPGDWRIVETGRNQSPIGWDGPDEGLYVMVEDTRTRFFHPNGFHYYSFYRVWIMPPNWEGEMRKTPYVTDSAPAFLLGVDDAFVAFYHTAGGNVWPDGPAALCRTLGLDDLCHTSISRRVVDLEFEERLMSQEEEQDLAVSRDRIIGLTGGENAVYLEYVFTTGEERPTPPLDELTSRIAGDVFSAFPEIESLYLRRCTSDTFTDTIVAR
jgi:hypothetical protein